MSTGIFQRKTPAWVTLSLCLGLGCSAQAQVTVERAWVRATVANQTTTGAFMRITAHKDVQLTAGLKATDARVSRVEVKAITSLTPPAP